MPKAIRLGVNIDHVATLRQARKTVEPDPLLAAAACEKAGADCITVHLREDRRHIQDRDVLRLKRQIQTKLNLEMADVPAIVRFALKLRPDQATLVPEKRREITTEGGLDVMRHRDTIKKTVRALRKASVFVSLFVDPDNRQIEAACDAGAQAVELHTGAYANARNAAQARVELHKQIRAARTAVALGMHVHAGHGLNYQNVTPILALPGLEEVNIGHSIVSRAVFTGLEKAVREMITLIRRA